MRPCFVFKAAANGKPPVLSIMEDIGFWGKQAKDFVAELAAVPGPDLRVEISSPGGDVFDGIAMYNALRASGKNITTVVMGVAASIASYVFLAGDTREMPKNTMLMVHNPWTFAAGNSAELREAADVLDKIGGVVQGGYLSRTGMKEEPLAAMLAKDTWLSADEALANGFATALTDDIKVQAKFDLARADLPAAAMRAFQSAAPAPPPAPAPAPAPVIDESPIVDQITVLAKAAGLDIYAGDLALGCATVEEAQARISTGREIVALCKLVQKDDEAAALVRQNVSVADARAALVKIMASADQHTNTAPKDKPAPQGSVSTGDIWAAHRKQSRNSK